MPYDCHFLTDREDIFVDNESYASRGQQRRDRCERRLTCDRVAEEMGLLSVETLLIPDGVWLGEWYSR